MFFVLQIFFTLSLTLLSVGIPYVQKTMFDSAAGTVNFRFVTINSVLAVSLGLVMIGLTLVSQRLVYSFNEKLSMELIYNILSIPRSKIEKSGSGLLTQVAVGDTFYVARMMNPYDIKLLFSIVSVVLIMLLTYTWSAVFFVITPLVYILSFLVIRVSSKMYAKYFNDGMITSNKLNPKIKAIIENSMAVNFYGNKKLISDEIRSDIAVRDRNGYLSMVANELGGIACDYIKIVARIGLILYAFNNIRQGRMTFGMLIAILEYFEFIFLPITNLQECMNNRSEFQLIETRFRFDNNYMLGGFELPKKTGCIELKNCSYKFDGSNDLCINNVSVLFDKGCTGLVGLSGEGKSTLLKLLTGEITPSSGVCEFGGVLINNLPRSFLQSEIAFFGQNLEIFDNDLLYNITLGRQPVEGEKQKIEIKNSIIERIIRQIYALKKIKKESDGKKIYCIKSSQRNDYDLLLSALDCNLYKMKYFFTESFIDSIIGNCDEISCRLADIILEKTYFNAESYRNILNDLDLHYLSGRFFGEYGNGLSGGEKQRITLARFLLKESSTFYIIDEPFTSLDAISESFCLGILNKWIVDKNGVIISHKLNIINKLCRHIVVLGNGSVVQEGVPGELSSAKGLYSDLYTEFISQR